MVRAIGLGASAPHHLLLYRLRRLGEESFTSPWQERGPLGPFSPACPPPHPAACCYSIFHLHLSCCHGPLDGLRHSASTFPPVSSAFGLRPALQALPAMWWWSFICTEMLVSQTNRILHHHFATSPAWHIILSPGWHDIQNDVPKWWYKLLKVAGQPRWRLNAAQPMMLPLPLCTILLPHQLEPTWRIWNMRWYLAAEHHPEDLLHFTS